MNDPAEPSAPGVDVGHLLDTSRFAGVPALVAVFTTLTLAFDGFDIQAIAFAAPALLRDWGIERAALAPVLAAGLLGMGVGALGIGVLGDHIGRRRALLCSLALVALASLASAYASGPGDLAVYRFLTGIGLGGTLPNAAALVAEFAPLSVRNVAMTITVVGVPIGGILGAAIAAEIIPTFGWRSIFIWGAVLPAVLVVFMLFLLPESARFLAARPARWPQLVRLLNRLSGAPRFDGTERFYVHEAGDAGGRAGVGALFSRELRYDTGIVWIIFLTNVFAVYALFNWLPTVLATAGLPIETAIRGSLVFNLGGVLGALAAAALMNRFGSRRVLVPFALAAVVSTFAIGWIPLARDMAVAGLLMTMAVSGACIIALQVGMYSVAAYIYPTACRSSGLGWALGIARLGGILSSFAGSILLGFGEGSRSFFAGIAAVLVLTLTGLLLLKRHLPAVR